MKAGRVFTFCGLRENEALVHKMNSTKFEYERTISELNWYPYFFIFV